MAKILLVDDDENFVAATAQLVRLEGHEVRAATSLESARKRIRDLRPDLMMVDLMLPDGSGFELLQEIEDPSRTRVVIVTGNTLVKSLIRSISGPSVEYLIKPFGRDKLRAVLDATLRPGMRQVRVPKANGSRPAAHFGRLIGESAAMQALYAAIQRVAPGDATVLITGERGTGKELVAHAIHVQSKRTGPFVSVSCAALSESLIANELFGAEQAGTNGAASPHVGFFKQADGGTLFLDEITEMPLELQASLQQFLDSGRMPGSDAPTPLKVNVRVIAASNRDLTRAVANGLLHEELYFSLMKMPINVEPLRNRAGDIELLAAHFLEELNKRYKHSKIFSSEAWQRLAEYSWPGNVRELKQVVQRAFTMLTGKTGELAIPTRPGMPIVEPEAPPCPWVGSSIKDVERQLILATLDRYDGNKRLAAETLQISLKTLYNRLERYRIEDARKKRISSIRAIGFGQPAYREQLNSA